MLPQGGQHKNSCVCLDAFSTWHQYTYVVLTLQFYMTLCTTSTQIDQLMAAIT